MIGYLGIDVGSVSTNLVLMTVELFASIYLRTRGKPIDTVQKGLKELGANLPSGTKVRSRHHRSGRHLTGVIVGADAVK